MSSNEKKRKISFLQIYVRVEERLLRANWGLYLGMSFIEIGDRSGRKVIEEEGDWDTGAQTRKSGDKFVQLHCCRELELEPKKRTCSHQVIRAYTFLFIILGLGDKNKLKT